MIDKKTFQDAISALKNYSKKEAALYNMGIDVSELVDELIDSYFQLLKYSTNDETELITYFCYDLDFGENYTPGCITDANDKEVRVQDSEDLYNVLFLDEAARQQRDKESNIYIQ